MVFSQIVLNFNSRPCERGDHFPIANQLWLLLYFNSRPCERGDISANFGKPCGNYFNSRPCERGDNGSLPAHLDSWIFQFPPLREGRHHRIAVLCSMLTISIPAPARGATHRGC